MEEVRLFLFAIVTYLFNIWEVKKELETIE